MMPITATLNITNTIPPPIVNTPLTDSAAQHVPVDNVPPSVSNAQVDNNARGNSTPPAPAEQPSAPTPDLSADEAFSAYLSSASTLNINAQATFLAQLIGQDVTMPPETAGILVQYEKLSSFANVRYKPSNAFRPEAAPSNAFSSLLNQTAPAVKTAPPEPVAIPVAPPAATVQPANDNVAAAANPAVQAASAYAESAARPAPATQAITDLA